MAIHVFYDNSNIIWGARYACGDLEPEVYEFAVRIHFNNIFQLIENSREVATKVLAGSVPPSSEPLWAYAQQNGYTTDLLRKVEKEDGTIGEQGVDELLHLKIANTLLDYPTGTLAIATGDGRTSKFGTGFLAQIDRALKHGWMVELWTWSQVCHHKYREYDEDNTKNLKLNEFDFHYYSITFLRQGEYYRDLPDGIRQRIVVPNRNVRPLRLF
jgi:hypothetical protein